MLKNIELILLALLVPITVFSMTPSQRLRNELKSVVSNKKVIFGHSDDTAYGHAWKYEPGWSDVKAVCGDFPGIINWDLGQTELQSDKNLDGVPFATMRRLIKEQNARGGINTLSWHLRNPLNGGDAWNCKSPEVVHQCVTEGTAMNDTLKVWVGRVADFIGNLRDSRGHRIPVVFRPWHEHTGSWFWWGHDFCTSQDYKALWWLVRKVFDEKGIDNVLWAYSPGTVETEAEYMERYPGDEYMDILGTDIYQMNGEKGNLDYKKSVDCTLSVIQAIARKHHKLMALTETGLESLPVADWWMSELLPAIKKYPICYVSVWRNAHDKPGHFFAPYPGQVSEKSFRLFYSDKSTLFAKDLKKIKK